MKTTYWDVGRGGVALGSGVGVREVDGLKEGGFDQERTLQFTAHAVV